MEFFFSLHMRSAFGYPLGMYFFHANRRSRKNVFCAIAFKGSLSKVVIIVVIIDTTITVRNSSGVNFLQLLLEFPAIRYLGFVCPYKVRVTSCVE